MATWIIVGASRGIGLEFVRQLLARGDHVIASIRDPAKASQLWALAGSAAGGSCQLFECDVTQDASITSFVSDVVRLQGRNPVDYVVLNAGILKYPNRATELSFERFSDHLCTNTIGPIICAQKLLKTGIPIGTLLFMSSDSGSTNQFRAFEDGFAAYAASKAALNQMLRHMAAELQRMGSTTTVLAMHPGEVSTEILGDESVGWDVEGVISAEYSVSAMLRVVATTTIRDTGKFLTWEGRSAYLTSMPPAIPRFLLPRRSHLLLQPRCRNLHLTPRNSAEKPFILEKPTKFNPPSHGARIPTSRRPQRTYGAPLTEAQKEQQGKKQYPRMMPPEGSFMHWFLTNRSIHLWITLGTLSCLAVFAGLENYHRTSPVAHLLPERRYFFSHPLDYLSQYLSVYKLHVEARSIETAERRRKKTEDMQKRDRYRKAHGIEDTQNVWGFGRRMGKVKEGEEGDGWSGDAEGTVDGIAGEGMAAEGGRTGDGAGERTFVDFEGRKKPIKKWLGIW